MRRIWLFAPFLGAVLAVGLGAARFDASPKAYLMYVASESEDEVAVLRFTAGAGFTEEKVVTVGWWPAEIESPHGVFVDPAGSHWYLTLGHGFPFGSLVKYEIGVDTVVGYVSLGLFPSTIAVSPQGGLAIAANSNFHGDKVPGTLSVVDLETMIDVAQIETCTMPHGSRFSADGSKHYSVCMVDDRLVEIDVTRLEVSRQLDLVADGGGRCSPTWVGVASRGATAYVACNAGNEILEVDLETWRAPGWWPHSRGRGRSQSGTSRQGPSSGRSPPPAR
jgi:DNA-binding beta-propeller fold protein YncE